MNRAALVMLLLLPPASASGEIIAGPVTVRIDNGHTQNCLDTMSGLCLAEQRGSSPSDTHVDVTQRVASITLALDDGELEERTELELLPDRALVLDARTLHFQQPVMRILAQQVGERSLGTPAGPVDVVVNATHRGWSTPWFVRNGSQLEATRWDMVSPHYDQGLTHDEVGAFSPYGQSSIHLDRDINGTNDCVGTLQHAGCPADTSPIAQLVMDHAPDAKFGIEIVEATIGDADALSRTNTALATRASAPGLARALPRAPHARALDTPPASAPLTTPHPGPASLADDPNEPTHAPRAPQELLTRTHEPIAPHPPHAPALLLAAATTLALAVIAATLYTRITRADATQSGARARILDSLAQHGPARIALLAQRLGIDRTTVDHHLRILLRTGHVTATRTGRMVVIALPGQDIQHAAQSVPERAEAAILHALDACNGAIPRDALLEHAPPDIPRRTLAQAVNTLARKGQLRCEWDGHIQTVRLLARDGAGA